MRQVTLKEMTLVNFKGQRSRLIEFTQQTNIMGRNKAGKSTIFDAFIWLLFGKDQFDRKDYEILPNNMERVDAEVSATLSVDGRNFNLKRVLHPKYVRRRGTSEEVYDGNETLFYIDDVPLRASEYKARVDMIIDETVFKLITNPAYFLSLNWTKQREILFQIAGTMSDAEIIATRPEFAALIDGLSGKSLAEFKKEITTRKKKLKDDLELIPSRVDQTTRLMPEAIDLSLINNEIAQIDIKITQIDDSIADRSAAIRSQYEEVQQKQREINALKTKQQDVVFKRQQEVQSYSFELNQKRSDLDNKLKAAMREVMSLKSSKTDSEQKVANFKKQLHDTENEIQALREQWHKENAAEYQAQDGCLTCPVFNITCSDAQATARYAEAQEKAKNAFFEAKVKKLEKINLEGAAKSEELNKLHALINAAENKLEQEAKALREAGLQVDELGGQLNAMGTWSPAPVVPEELPEWQELDKQIKTIQTTIQDVKPVDNAELLLQKKELVAKRDELKDVLSKQALIPQYREEIKKLEKQASDLAQQIAGLEKEEFAIADFTRVKIEESEARINSMFRIVRFKLFDKTIDGNEYEACIPINLEGLPIAATNSAEKVNAGLDIINTLCRFNNVTAPIFCDNRESTNDIVEMSSQIINLVVTRDPELVIN